MLKKIIIGNWKMNPADSKNALKIFGDIKKGAKKFPNITTVIAPPAIFIPQLKSSITQTCLLGAQDAHFDDTGAYTGTISAKMLKNFNVSYCIVGHSEVRARGDNDEIVNKKILSILKNGMSPILCVGEKTRTDDHWHFHIVKEQIEKAFVGISKNFLKKIVIAYEPVWAIGQNAIREATPEECREMIIFIRRVLADMYTAKDAQTISILYGGSVSVENCLIFLKDGNIDGFLVGRESLNPKHFLKIIETANIVSSISVKEIKIKK